MFEEEKGRKNNEIKEKMFHCSWFCCCFRLCFFSMDSIFSLHIIHSIGCHLKTRCTFKNFYSPPLRLCPNSIYFISNSFIYRQNRSRKQNNNETKHREKKFRWTERISQSKIRCVHTSEKRKFNQNVCV